jgi:mannose-6-phosphate isomerase-like protein (cupin superfamily)
MDIKRRDEVPPFEFADFTLRELTPEPFVEGSIAELTVPVGSDRPTRVNEKDHRIYVCLAGVIEFRLGDTTLRISQGDVLHIDKGEEYGFHNGGYEEGRLILIRMPGPTSPDRF